VSRPTVAELQRKYRHVDMGEVADSTSHTRLAAEIYSLLDVFQHRWFGWREWAAHRAKTSDADTKSLHRGWRVLRSKLNIAKVPHETRGAVIDGQDATEIRLCRKAWHWQAQAGGLVCAGCGELFTPTASDLGLAYFNNRVWCSEACRG
jgi:hypothetical protein